jgi:hypothetical protein
MAHDIQCWKCGTSLAYLPLPFGRIERCKSCDADIHVCKLCKEFDRTYPQQCREPTVEEVRDKEHANFATTPSPAGETYGEKPRPDSQVRILRSSTARAEARQIDAAQFPSVVRPVRRCPG